MKRQDLVRFNRFQNRTALAMLVVILGGVALSTAGYLEKIAPSWRPSQVVPWLGGLALLFFLLVVMRGFVGLPKCPHCSARLTGWLLHIAIASGNCGMCGNSVEDEDEDD